MIADLISVFVASIGLIEPVVNEDGPKGPRRGGAIVLLLGAAAITALIVGYSRAPAVTPGSVTYTSGTNAFTVPAYNSITFTFFGAGGEGGHPFVGGPCTDNAGSTSAVIGGVTRSAGAGHPGSGVNSNPGPGGAASGGNISNDNGASGAAGSGATIGGAGGSAPGGGAGGAAASAGSPPGGGGGGANVGGTGGGGGGGGGARMIYTATAGTIMPGTSISITVGARGSACGGGAGARGEARVVWSFLLYRDFDPANDNAPAWLVRAA